MSADLTRLSKEELIAACRRLQRENENLRRLLPNGGFSLGATAADVDETEPPAPLAHSPAETPIAGMMPTPPAVHNRSSNAEKIRLFRSLFRGREDVYAVRWESRSGRSGYTFACRHEWVPGVCEKPRIKCAACPHRAYLPVTDAVIERHLTGALTVGIHPMLMDETCRFLTVDFDGASWRQDVIAFLDACQQLDISAALERSRSGQGAHVWIFFAGPLPASQARKLGSLILTLATDMRHQISLKSYDRFFPNQDTMPKGGLGNLIALPLQKVPRMQGNSVFLDAKLEPHEDQWVFLSTIAPLAVEAVQRITASHTSEASILGVADPRDEDDAHPWEALTRTPAAAERISGPFPDCVRIVMSNLSYIEKSGLPPSMINRLQRLAAFQNPQFYEAQSLRLSTYKTPRIIHCAEDFPQYVGLPRGCLDAARNLLEEHEIFVNIEDKRQSGHEIEAQFHGQLRPLQLKAVQAILAHDTGVLCAATAFGKTVAAAYIIGERKVNTLILVHRQQLLDQWCERLSAFLEWDPKRIGRIGGGKHNPTGDVDVATMQSLIKKDQVDPIIAGYGQVIVDECHHVSAFSFEQILKHAHAHYVLGLTATPVRKDGHHPIIFMQCGPIRFRVHPKQQVEHSRCTYVVIPRYTGFTPVENEANPSGIFAQGIESPGCDAVPISADISAAPASFPGAGIQTLFAKLSRDDGRTSMIVEDVLAALDQNRFPLVLTERTGHLEQLTALLREQKARVIQLRGGMSSRQRREAIEQIQNDSDPRPFVITATGRYAGEGFDVARLDTLFLAMPISWRGTLQQYVGRLHREHTDKTEVRVYDYVDSGVPALERMYQKRLKGYKTMGYQIRSGVR